jgi:hypothetical protein
MTLVALLSVLAVGVWGAFAVFAAAGTAAPTLTSTPANPTAATSATFGYSESAANATFVCTLDGAGKTCAGTSGSGKTTGSVTFSSLANGSHTFSITATVSGKTSAATSFTWTVDTTAPTATISFPTNNGLYNIASYNAGCATAGICGTATDPSGVKSVQVSVLGPNGKYLNGGTFTSSTEVFNSATGTTSWNLALPASAGGEGSYVVGVHTTDNLNNTQPPVGVPSGGGTTAGFYAATASYRIDLTAPPAPTITNGPSGTVASSAATFQFTSNDTGPGTDTFLCKLDAGSYAACVSGVSYSGLTDGSHSFSVEAKDAAGNISTGASTRGWTVDKTGPPKPTVLGPNNNNPSTAATLTFSDTETNVTFKCQMDGHGYAPCTSPTTYTLLPAGTHVFDVEPLDQLGNVGPFNEWKWTISGSSGAGLPFQISLGTLPLLHPGAAADTIDLSLYNPNTATIYVNSLTLSMTGVTRATGVTLPCGTGDFTFVGFSPAFNSLIASNPIVLGAGQTKKLSDLGLSAYIPTIAMKETGVKQDGCIGAKVNFSFGGSGQS